MDIDTSTVAALQTVRDRQAAQPDVDVGQLVFRRPTALRFKPWRPDRPRVRFD